MPITRDDWMELLLIVGVDDFNAACGDLINKYFEGTERKDDEYPMTTEDAIVWDILDKIRRREQCCKVEENHG